MNNRNWRGFLAWAVFAGILFFIFQSMKTVAVVQDINYSEFKTRLHDGQVDNVKVRPDLITGTFKTADNKIENFRTIPVNDPGLVDDLERNHA